MSFPNVRGKLVSFIKLAWHRRVKSWELPPSWRCTGKCPRCSWHVDRVGHELPQKQHGGGSKPITINFSGMNIYLQAIYKLLWPIATSYRSRVTQAPPSWEGHETVEGCHRNEVPCNQRSQVVAAHLLRHLKSKGPLGFFPGFSSFPKQSKAFLIRSLGHGGIGYGFPPWDRHWKHAERDQRMNDLNLAVSQLQRCTGWSTDMSISPGV